jgi:hypothetical protein
MLSKESLEYHFDNLLTTLEAGPERADSFISNLLESGRSEK